VVTLIAVTIAVLLNVAIMEILAITRIVLQTGPMTIVTVVPTKKVTKIVSSVCPHPTSMTVVAVVPRATTATHTLTVTHAAVIGPLVPLPNAIVRNLLREVIADLEQPEAVLLTPNMMIYLLNVGESYLGGDISAQER